MSNIADDPNISHERYKINRLSDKNLYHTSDMDDRTLGFRLREARKQAGLTQKGLADKAKISQTTVSDLERGRNMKSSELPAIAQALGVTVESLTGLTTAMQKKDGLTTSQGLALVVNPIQQQVQQYGSGRSAFARVTEIDGMQYVPIIGKATMGTGGYFTPVSDDNVTGDGYVRFAYGRTGQYSYALRGDGECLEPAVRDRWIIVFDPEVQLVPTEYVHVSLRDGRETIKELVAVTDEVVHLLAIKDNRRIVIPLDEVEGMAKFVAIFPPSARVLELPPIIMDSEFGL